MILVALIAWPFVAGIAAWLAGRRRSISEIAFQLAFPSAQYFATVFRRYTGMTPGQYRRQCGKNGEGRNWYDAIEFRPRTGGSRS